MMIRQILLMLVLCLVQTAFAQPTTRFIVVGDTRGSDDGINATILSELVQATLNDSAHFILIPGDLVTGSSDTSTFKSQLLTWRNTVQPLYDANIGVYPCRGNHDAYSKVIWDDVFSGVYALPDNGPAGEENITYSVTYNNVLAIAFDQYVNDYQINQPWLDEQLATNFLPHVFAFGHTPAFSVRHSDCLDDYPDERDTFWLSLGSAGGRIYFCGHDHFYDHARLDDGDGNPDNDLHQYLTGAGGAPLYDDSEYDGNNSLWTPVRILHDQQYGYALIEISGLNVQVTYKHRTEPGIYEAMDDIFIYTAISKYPIFTQLPGINLQEDIPDTIQLSHFFPYVEDGNHSDDSLTWEFFDSQHVTVQFLNDSLTLTPEDNWFGIDSFMVIAMDPDQLADTIFQVVQINPVNDWPQAFDDLASTPEDVLLRLDILENDRDVDDSLRISSHVAVIDTPHHGEINLDPDTRELIYSPLSDWYGQDSLTYTVQDDSGAISNLANVFIIVTPVNDAPIALDDIASTPEDFSVIF